MELFLSNTPHRGCEPLGALKSPASAGMAVEVEQLDSEAAHRARGMKTKMICNDDTG